MRRSVGEARRKRDAQERGQWDGKRLADVLRCSETAHEVIQRAEAEARRLREFGRARFAALPAQKHALLSPEVVQALEEPVRETVTPTDLQEAWDWDWEKAAPVADEIRRALDRVPVISADNVAEYLYANGIHKMEVGEFPALAPPFPAFWVEVRKTPELVRKKMGGFRWGALFRATELDEGGWRMTAHHILAAGDQIMALDKPTVVLVDAAGTPVSWERTQGLGDPDNPDEGFEFVSPLLMAVAFMNCANVEHYEVEPPRALSKKREQKHGKPLVRYRVIEISPKTRAQATDGIGTGEHRALHICRGHFARYTESAPLFGHFVGTVWKPAHVRGRASQGVVKKDYKVKLDEASA